MNMMLMSYFILDWSSLKINQFQRLGETKNTNNQRGPTKIIQTLNENNFLTGVASAVGCIM